MHGVYNQLLSPAACTPRSKRDDVQTSLVRTRGRRPPDDISYACKEMLERTHLIIPFSLSPYQLCTGGSVSIAFETIFFHDICAEGL